MNREMGEREGAADRDKPGYSHAVRRAPEATPSETELSCRDPGIPAVRCRSEREGVGNAAMVNANTGVC